MSKIVQASELEPGDLYRTYSGMYRDGAGGADVRRIVGRRIVRSTETYAVLETEDLLGRGLRGEISLRADLSIERLNEIPLAEIENTAKYMMPGEQLNLVMYDGRIWE